MSRLSTSLGIKAQPVSRYSAPDDALRRLDLPGQQPRRFMDLVHLGSTSLQQAIRSIDNEGQAMESAHLRSTAAIDALKTAQDKLDELSKLQQANSRRGSSRLDRRDNQKRIDVLLKEIDEAFASASTKTTQVFDGSVTLQVKNQSIELPPMSLESLGRVAVDGQMRSLADLASHKALDTTQQRSSRMVAAQRSLKAAQSTVVDLRKKLEAVSSENIRSRLGDVAEVFAGLYDVLGNQQITTMQQGRSTLSSLRDLTLQTSAVAVAVGADGWDRQRVIDLLSPT